MTAADGAGPAGSGASVAVTGGAGFIGSHLVERLAANGPVVVVDDLSVGREEDLAPAFASGRVRLVRADVRDADALARAFAGVEVVFHLAVRCLRLSFRDPTGVHEVNATGTLNALRAASSAGVPRFVYVSSSEVYGNAVDSLPIDEGRILAPTTPYAASKAAGEMYARAFADAHGLSVTIVRPFNSYGPRSHAAGPYGEVIPRFVARLLQGRPPVVFGTGEQTRDFTYVEDTARGIAAAAADVAAGEVVNVATGRGVSVLEVAEAVARATGRPDLRPVPGPARPADVRSQLASTDKARHLLGFLPRVGLEEGLRRYVDWVRERGVAVSAEEAGRPNW
jgi:UDP-glucose 4-epimerase